MVFGVRVYIDVFNDIIFSYSFTATLTFNFGYIKWTPYVDFTGSFLDIVFGLPHPIFPRCDMLVLWLSLNGHHKSTAMCRSGAERMRRRLAETEVRESTEMAFGVYEEQLQTVPSFKYLRRTMREGDNDWQAVAGNLGKARKSWGRLYRILSREGANKKLSWNFFKAVVQQVLLFGAET